MNDILEELYSCKLFHMTEIRDMDDEYNFNGTKQIFNSSNLIMKNYRGR